MLLDSTTNMVFFRQIGHKDMINRSFAALFEINTI